jgi:3-hydroxyisobutyrate dehydrogenase-like beta-hydroxyacid dehydrogenase
MTDAMRVGFVGFGEAGVCFAQGLTQAGIREISVYCDGPHHRPPYDDAFRNTVVSAGGKTVDSLAEVLHSSDAVFSAVVASSARQVGEAMAKRMSAGQMLIDINACGPEDKIAVSEAAAAVGADYVDVSLMGAVSLYKHKVPLEVSGTGAGRFERAFTPLGFNIHVIDDRAGSAATIKMLRSIALKGMGSAVLEALVAGTKAGLMEETFHAICDPMDATKFSAWTIMAVLTSGIHADRRADEMEAAVTFMQSLGLEPVMTAATLDSLRRTGALNMRSQFPNGTPADYKEMLPFYLGEARQPQPVKE